MASDPKVHKYEEVAKHSKTQDCWLVISGKVFDVTPFMDDHPGGDEVQLSATGKDATNDFEDVGHSDSARDMMDKYNIGEVDPSTVPLKRTCVPPPQAGYNPDKISDFVIKILQFLVPLLRVSYWSSVEQLKVQLLVSLMSLFIRELYSVFSVLVAF